jgi:hypothetical protein
MFLACTRRKGYNCVDFACDVWKYLTGEDVKARYSRSLLALKRRKKVADIEGFKSLELPLSPCVVLMQRPKHDPHVGIFYEGRILHLADRGAQFELPEVATVGFQVVRYYR